MCDGVLKTCISVFTFGNQEEKKRKDYAFWRGFNENPSIIPGCPGIWEIYNWEVSSQQHVGCMAPIFILHLATLGLKHAVLFDHSNR